MSRQKLYLVLVLVVVLAVIYRTSRTKPSAKPADPKSSHKVRTPENPLFNLPNIYFERTSTSNRRPYVQICGRFPDIFTIKFSNDYWQVQETSNGTFHLLDAFLDERKLNRQFDWKKRYVRIVGMFNRVDPGKYFCQFWYGKDGEPFVIKSEKLLWIWNKNWERLDSFHQPYLISCVLPDRRVPISVSLVEKTCDRATNNLRVFYAKEGPKKDFVVCVKGLSFPYEDKTARLAEWIELVRILGADKIHFYKFNVHPNTQKLLDYYRQQDKIEISPLTLVGEAPNRPNLQHHYLQQQTMERRLQEVIPYNDCFYRYIYQYRYVVLLDIDEIIVPIINNSWSELMETLQEHQSKASSYVVKKFQFDHSEIKTHKNIPPYMHKLRHIHRRNDADPADYVKGFYDTDQVVAVYSKKSPDCEGWRECGSREIGASLAQLQHYGDDCNSNTTYCENIEDGVDDSRLWSVKDLLIERVTKTLKDLDFLKSQNDNEIVTIL